MTIYHSFLNPSSRWYYPLRWLLLILLGLAVYGQTFGFNFVFDDNYYLFNTPYVRSFDQIDQIWTVLPKTRLVGIYSLALNYHINRLHPQGYHIFNFVVHLLAVGLVWSLATVLFKITKESLYKAPQELPYLIAVLFLVHPGQTQAVTYISQRFESMATVFYLGSIYSYLRGRISSSTKHKIFLFICSAGFAILGIFTKEVAATIPMMVLAAEFIILNRSPINLKRSPSLGFYLPVAILGVLFIFLFMNIVKTDFINIYFRSFEPSDSHDGDIITGGKYVLTQMRVFLTFLRLLILPINQNLDYDYPLSTGLLDPPLTLVGLGVIGLFVFLVFRLRKQWPLIAFGLAWILITFSINTAPRANLIFEHKLYLISFGFFLAVVCALSTIIKDRKILYGVLIAFIAVLSLASWARNQVWRSEWTLWNDTVQKSPHKARPYNGLGIAYGKQGKLTQALSNFNKAIAINPSYSEAYNNRGNIYFKQGNYSQANSDFNKAIAINPNYADAYTNLGNIYGMQGNFTQALFYSDKAIAIDPYYVEAYNNRGNAFFKQGNYIQASSDLNKAIAINPNYVQAYNNLGNIYVSQGDFTQALSDYNKAIGIDPGYTDAYYNRGLLYGKQGDFTQAILDFNDAIRIDPDYVDAYYNRGLAYSKQGNYAQAIVDFTKTIKIDSYHAGAYYNRGLILAKQGDFIQAMSDFNKAIKINPGNAEAYINRGVIFAQRSDLAQALSDYKKAIKINPDYTSAYIDRGTLYAQQGNFTKAISDYDKAIALNPDFQEAYINRAVSYYQLKEYDKAWGDVRRAEELGGSINPNFIKALKKVSGKGQ